MNLTENKKYKFPLLITSSVKLTVLFILLVVKCKFLVMFKIFGHIHSVMLTFLVRIQPKKLAHSLAINPFQFCVG